MTRTKKPDMYKYSYTFSDWRESVTPGWRFLGKDFKGGTARFWHGGTPYMGHVALTISGPTKFDVEKAIAHAIRKGYLSGSVKSAKGWIRKRGYY